MKTKNTTSNAGEPSIPGGVVIIVVVIILIIALIFFKRKRDSKKRLSKEKDVESPNAHSYAREQLLSQLMPQERVDTFKQSLERQVHKLEDSRIEMYSEPWLLYDFLGVPITATAEEISASVQQEIAKFKEKDFARCTDVERAAAIRSSKILLECKDVLCNVQKRAIYDNISTSKCNNPAMPFGSAIENLKRIGHI